MSIGDLDKVNPRHLARMLGVDAKADPERGEELGSILRRQLMVRLAIDPREWVQCSSPPPVQQSLSFGEILAHPAPPPALLERIKQFAKISRSIEGGLLPVEVATVLYFASITAALLRCGERITHLDDHAIRGGVEWALSHPWLEEPLRALFQQGLLKLPPPTKPPGDCAR